MSVCGSQGSRIGPPQACLFETRDRRDINGGAIPQASGKSEDWAHSFHALRESEKAGPEIQDGRKGNEGDRR